MSLILDALRKIEQERKTRRQGNGDLRADVLNYRGTAPPPSARRFLPAVSCILVVLVAVAGFLLWRNNNHHQAASVRPAAAESPLQPAARQAVPATQPVQVAPPVPAMRPPVATSRRDKAVARQLPAPQPVTIRTDAASSAEEKSLLVSGIAWQEERGLRRAVVNGSLVGEGAEILGAKVVEIRENRVRFSREGRSFEVIYQGNTGR